MNLLCSFLISQEAEMVSEGICLRGIGEREMLPQDVRDLLERVERNTAHNRDLLLTLAISYDGRRDLVKAAQNLVRLARKGQLLPADVHEELLLGELSTQDTPDVDLVIRTSGERRLSGFLPIEACYAELVFIEKTWPEFCVRDLDAAIEEYQIRQRRFGLTGHQLEVSFSPT
jgi:undecaprenyl diphosphate synthase